MEYEQLKLDNQLCFPVYAASRLITRVYQPYLEKLGLTYPQYLVLLVLWETNRLPVNDIAKKLVLNTNTITPLLKRMETIGFIIRTRSSEDERKVMVELTDKGSKLRHLAAIIPGELANNLLTDEFKIEELVDLKNKLTTIIQLLANK